MSSLVLPSLYRTPTLILSGEATPCSLRGSRVGDKWEVDVGGWVGGVVCLQVFLSRLP